MFVPSQNNGRTRNGKYYQTHCQNGHEFNEVNTYVSPKLRRRTCRLCQSARNKRQWRENLEANRVAAKEHMWVWREANRERHNRNWTEGRRCKKAWIDAYKAKHPCMRCGASHIACLDFHHRNPKEKELTISLAIARASLERIQKEVAKCDILCANCHRKEHWQQ